MKGRFYSVPTVRIRQVIELTTTEGEGTEESVIRAVRYYHDLDGTFLARHDAKMDKQREEERKA